MKYRIKKITRNNGTETYIPQVQKYKFGWWENIFDLWDIPESRALNYINSHKKEIKEEQGKKVKKVEVINIV